MLPNYLSSATGLPSSPVSFWEESPQRGTRGEIDLLPYLSTGLHPTRFGPPLLPANWTPDPTRVWESKWDVQLQDQNDVAVPVGGTVSWKAGMTADQVRAT